MRSLVTYYSPTGNTRKVAEAIFNSLEGDKEIKPFDDVASLDGIDLTFIGFPVMQFGPPAAARNFIASHATGKKIALFITHAMLTEIDNPEQKAMLLKELDKCRSICLASELTGFFHCQGELSEKMSEELMASGIPMLMDFAKMRPATLGHPNPEEIARAARFAVCCASII